MIMMPVARATLVPTVRCGGTRIRVRIRAHAHVCLFIIANINYNPIPSDPDRGSDPVRSPPCVRTRMAHARMLA
jgi:hypothetical protein